MLFEAPKVPEISRTSPLVKEGITENIKLRPRWPQEVPDKRCWEVEALKR